jgi:hypothetical protein
MPRYIAGIRREARKYAGFEGFFVPNATKPLSPENRPNPESAGAYCPLRQGGAAIVKNGRQRRTAEQAVKKFRMNRIAANGQFPLILSKTTFGCNSPTPEACEFDDARDHRSAFEGTVNAFLPGRRGEAAWRVASEWRENWRNF